MRIKGLDAAFILIISCLIIYVLLTVASITKPSPVKYIYPFNIIEKDGGYKAGDEVLVEIEMCIIKKGVHYNSITQKFINQTTGVTYFTNPIIDLSVTKEDILGWEKSNTGSYYTEGDYHCTLLFGVPKTIPAYVDAGEYILTFAASVEGMDNLIHYETEPFTINK